MGESVGGVNKETQVFIQPENHTTKQANVPEAWKEMLGVEASEAVLSSDELQLRKQEKEQKWRQRILEKQQDRPGLVEERRQEFDEARKRMGQQREALGFMDKGKQWWLIQRLKRKGVQEPERLLTIFENQEDPSLTTYSREKSCNIIDPEKKERLLEYDGFESLIELEKLATETNVDIETLLERMRLLGMELKLHDLSIFYNHDKVLEALREVGQISDDQLQVFLKQINQFGFLKEMGVWTDRRGNDNESTEVHVNEKYKLLLQMLKKGGFSESELSRLKAMNEIYLEARLISEQSIPTLFEVITSDNIVNINNILRQIFLEQQKVSEYVMTKYFEDLRNLEAENLQILNEWINQGWLLAGAIREYNPVDSVKPLLETLTELERNPQLKQLVLTLCTDAKIDRLDMLHLASTAIKQIQAVSKLGIEEKVDFEKGEEYSEIDSKVAQIYPDAEKIKGRKVADRLAFYCLFVDQEGNLDRKFLQNAVANGKFLRSEHECLDIPALQEKILELLPPNERLYYETIAKLHHSSANSFFRAVKDRSFEDFQQDYIESGELNSQFFDDLLVDSTLDGGIPNIEFFLTENNIENFPPKKREFLQALISGVFNNGRRLLLDHLKEKCLVGDESFGELYQNGHLTSTFFRSLDGSASIVRAALELLDEETLNTFTEQEMAYWMAVKKLLESTTDIMTEHYIIEKLQAIAPDVESVKLLMEIVQLNNPTRTAIEEYHNMLIDESTQRTEFLITKDLNSFLIALIKRNPTVFADIAHRQTWKDILGKEQVENFLQALPPDEKRNAFMHNDYDRTTEFMKVLATSPESSLELSKDLPILTEFVQKYGLARVPLVYHYFKHLYLFENHLLEELPQDIQENAIASLEQLYPS